MTDLPALLTPDQRAELARRLAQVLEDGFGEVTIVVQKGVVRFIRTSSSHDLGNPANEREHGSQLTEPLE